VVKRFFSLAVRLLICFLVAKLLLRTLGWDNFNNLVILTLLLLANVYWFDFLDYREGRYSRRERGTVVDVKPGSSEP